MTVPNLPTRDDHVLIETRVVAAIVIPVLLLAFVILYLNPDQTDQHFSWTIKPAMTPIAMGAGYLMGAYFFARVLTTSRWHRVAAGFLPITAFTVVMAIATILHWDRFHHGTLAATLWIILYAVTPFLVPFLWYRNQTRANDEPEPDDLMMPAWTPWVSRLAGGVITLAGLAILMLPDLAIQLWPWQLTPLTARVIAGWLMLPGIGALYLARETRWSGWRVVVEATTVGSIALFIGIIRAWNDWNTTNPFSVIIASGVGVALMCAPALWLRMTYRKWSAGESW